MLLHLLFFCSGVSGLIYQIVWVRQFGHVFGNTVYSASLVVAIFMVGLGLGGYLLGASADERYKSRPDGLVRMYGALELLIAAFALGVSMLLPHLGPFAARVSWYEAGLHGWFELSYASYLTRGAVAVALLAPITLLMGGTLTILIRAVVRDDLPAAGTRVGWLYGVNTLGAASGALLTDFVLVPSTGLFGTQLLAIAFNAFAAAGAFWLARGERFSSRSRRAKTDPVPIQRNATVTLSGSVLWAAAALALSGFAALGMEMLWLRHLGVLLGGFRAVFSLLLAVILVALGAGALLGGWLNRRFAQPARTMMLVQAFFVATMLLGMVSTSAETLANQGRLAAATIDSLSASARLFAELWFNLRPMMFEVGVPSFVAGLAFPLANALVQSSNASVGRRAGVLYAANTIGAVAGSLVTGYLLLPFLGMQASVGVLAGIGALAIGPLFLAQRPGGPGRLAVPASAAAVAVGAIAAWLALPSDFLLRRATGLSDANERVLAVSEGVTELLAVVDRPGRGRGLLTNGHAMSSTALLDQRYMRALAHIPLLAMERPERVLVIGFGVGNTAHAATLHGSVSRVDIADLSPHILEHAGYFRDANRDVLTNPKTAVFINDGRQHLQMAAPATYDLITLEPPPIAHAGVAALYSREFYQLARSRLTDGGYVSQWLPAYQVPAESSLAMVRAFLDVFPHSVLLSGAQAELLLLGTSAARVELDPQRVAGRLEREPAVRQDLERVNLGSVREIAGTFVGSADTLARAVAASPAVTDDRPLQEYGVISGLSAGLMGVPASLFDVASFAEWCPRCAEEEGARLAPNLDLYLRLLQQAYIAPVRDAVAAAAAGGGQRRLLGSSYLGAVVPDSAEVHNLLGLVHARDGRLEDAAREFEAAIGKDPRSANARANLGQIRYEQGAVLLDSRRFADAAAALATAVELMPDSAEAHNDLGVALASLGRIGEAAEHFRRAVGLQPDFAEARENLGKAAGS